jgi:hypothetical protein
MMRPPSLGSTPVPDRDGTAELQLIADMLAWSMAMTAVVGLVLVGLALWLVFGRGTSQGT